MREMRKTIFHATDDSGGYKVLEVTRTEMGEFFLRMSKGTKGDKESREYLTMKLTEDEAAGLKMALERMLLVE